MTRAEYKYAVSMKCAHYGIRYEAFRRPVWRLIEACYTNGRSISFATAKAIQLQRYLERDRT